MRSTATMFLRRNVSTASAGRRVLCSLQELQDLQGQGLKFPVHPPEPKEAAPTADAKTTTKPRRRRDLLTTGFVFFNEKTRQPRAFINRYLDASYNGSDAFILHFSLQSDVLWPLTGVHTRCWSWTLTTATSSAKASSTAKPTLRSSIQTQGSVYKAPFRHEKL